MVKDKWNHMAGSSLDLEARDGQHKKGSDNFHSACVSYIVSFPKTQSSGLNLEDRR